MNNSKVANKQVYRVVIEAPIEKVWNTLTKTGEVLPFFFSSVLHTTSLGPGAPIRMRSPNGKLTAVVGDVLEFEPPRLFSHTFKFTNLNDPVCQVTYELKPIEGGTEFTLTTTGVPVGTKTEKYMGGGSKVIVNTLKALVETGRPTFMARFIGWVNVLMVPFTPKVCRSQNWPLDRKIE
jgi:uncharacterized protein YndB with AHSA1/START domain